MSSPTPFHKTASLIKLIIMKDDRRQSLTMGLHYLRYCIGEKMTKTYVVTGGAGFIGSHIAARLLRDGHRVRVIDNLSTGKKSNIRLLESLGGDFSFNDHSITNATALANVMKDAEVVFHHAALASVPFSIENPLETHRHCATGTLMVLDAARQAGVRRVVYAGSSSAYGDTEVGVQSEDLIPAPISPYGVAKLAGEYYCRTFTYTYGLETVVLRYFNVFGPRQDPTSAYAAVIPKFIARMVNGQAPLIFGDGTQTRDFTAVDNVVHGNLLAADAPAANGQVINLAMGEPINLLTLVEKLNNILGTDFQPIFQPPRIGDIKHSRASIERAKTLLKYTPVTNFDDGLQQTVQFFR